jgi:hypothetical protein
MSKKNKVRYSSKGNQWPQIPISGRIFLRHRDDDILGQAVKGDMLVFLSTDAFKFNLHIGDYEAMGLEGYLKADVFDGKGWKPLSIEEFFLHREQYFNKRERPCDTFAICEPILKAAAGKMLMRTYREHYVLVPEGTEEGD